MATRNPGGAAIFLSWFSRQARRTKRKRDYSWVDHDSDTMIYVLKTARDFHIMLRCVTFMFETHSIMLAYKRSKTGQHLLLILIIWNRSNAFEMLHYFGLIIAPRIFFSNKNTCPDAAEEDMHCVYCEVSSVVHRLLLALPKAPQPWASFWHYNAKGRTKLMRYNNETLI